ncbi:helix-turn-helix domain-containing protein [Corynebacterium cystitidis]|uniref:DNA binding domain-containing protein, excisionase family n=1 Tax=Corynebacterium cystitidis DSM 20524 TaxID=1121357 RepID=A0A1H9UNU4_9CORY|nr:excisionase family DNA-binding protein [Corynebacterium cystitidis]WJY81050.1 Helix-turn-helix domain protein [Corynebacterium cystitidis DSM 20524]SES10874.1 DNA binding domain-containing protein, excisionase family [Corynebacterium cystitidis DSM 20524]SNV90400.1 excisionase [Corynebacterium cystitidis]
MATTVAPEIELTQKIQEQADHVVSSNRSVHDLTHGAIPHELANVIETVLRAAANGETITLSRLPEVLTTTEAARQLGISRPTLMRKIKKGEIDSFKVGTHTRIKAEAVFDYRRKRHTEAKKAFEEMRLLDDDIFD